MQRSNQRRAAYRGPVMPPRLSNEESGPLVASSHRRPLGSPHIDQESTPKPPSNAEIRGGVYIISVAARILDMHPQTLRKYERLGLVTPTRSMGMLRLYSAEDVVRVRLIKYMVDDLRMNLAGVEFALNFLSRIMGLRERIQAMARAEALNKFVAEELEEMLRGLGSIFPDNPSKV